MNYFYFKLTLSHTTSTYPELVHITSEKVKVVRDNLKIARDRQKSYADNRRRDLQFEIGDRVFLKISPWKGVFRFGKRGKLSPRYIGPYEIVSKVGPVAYKLKLPPELSRIHDTFHVSMLRKYILDPSHVLREQPVQLKENLTYEETPVQIVDHKEQVLRSKVIPLVKVLWKNHEREAATGSQRLICAVTTLNYFPNEVLSFSFEFSLFISRTKCSKGERICNAPSRDDVQYM